MKKLLLVALLFVGATQIANAQLQFGVKAGVNYNSDSFKDVSNDVLNGAESKTGYHAGIWVRAKLPGLGFYVRPELIYTELKNEVNYDNSLLVRSTDFNLQKIDVPVLFGKKIFNVGNIFIGPSFQFVLGSDFSLSDLKEVSTSNFSAGVQMGAGVELGKLGIDVRWERGLSNNEIKFIDNISNTDVQFDARVNQIIFGISYRL